MSDGDRDVLVEKIEWGTSAAFCAILFDSVCPF